MISINYKKQVGLLLNTIPLIAKEACFALKGGTAINMFYNNLPRLSVDIDLAYVPIENRNDSYLNINEALQRIMLSIEKTGASCKLQGAHEEKKIICSNG